MSVRTYMVQYVGRSLRLPRLERQVDVIYEHGTGREYRLVRKPTWSEESGYVCECGARVRGYKRRCPECLAWLDYDGVGPKAVLD